jgi:hypothetical protein
MPWSGLPWKNSTSAGARSSTTSTEDRKLGCLLIFIFLTPNTNTEADVDLPSRLSRTHGGRASRPKTCLQASMTSIAAGVSG